MKRVIGIIACAALMAGIYFWTGKVHYVNLPPKTHGNWVAFGDSLTAGFGAAEGHDYPTLLGEQLGLTIVNEGKSGDTSQDGLARLEQVLRTDPRVVLLCFGGNDTLQSIPLHQTIANVGVMIDQLVARGTFVVLIGIRSASLRDKNETSFRKLANEKMVLYVPNFLKGVLGDPALMSDYVHPNDAGYEYVAGRLEKILRPYMPQL